MMNNYDLLLHWLSALPKGEASTATVDNACAALAQRMNLWRTDADPRSQSSRRYHFLDTLHRLGHVEPVGRDRWAVIPPVLLWVSSKQPTGEAHLYGARSKALGAQLTKAYGNQFEAIPQTYGPELWRFSGTRAEAQALAQEFKDELRLERGEELLASLPSLSEAVQHFRQCTLPKSGECWQFFQIRGTSWEWVSRVITQNLEEGVYRTGDVHPTAWLYISRKSGGSQTQARLLDERNGEQSLIARWLELARTGKLGLMHDALRRELAIPYVGLPLPILLDRALRLASGRCPEIMPQDRQRFLVFSNIPHKRARHVGRVLGMRVETRPWMIQLESPPASGTCT